MPLICPYCRTDVEPDGGEGLTCEGCGTPHHRDCYEENGGCTLFGCHHAPPDDPKVQVSPTDVAQAPGVFGTPAPYTAATGFGDVNASMGVAAAAIALETPPPPPPPPPPGESRGAPEQPSALFMTAMAQQGKPRITFILLGVFLGIFGVHNFYAGYWKRGLAQAAVTLGTFFYAALAVWIWALVEVCTVDQDRHKIRFV